MKLAAIRTTITVDVQALNDAKAQAKKNGESLKSFLERAIVNQLETEGDFETRYAVSRERESEQFD